MKGNGEDRGGNLSSETPHLVIFRTFSGMESRPFKLTHIIPEAHEGDADHDLQEFTEWITHA